MRRPGYASSSFPARQNTSRPLQRHFHNGESQGNHLARLMLRCSFVRLLPAVHAVSRDTHRILFVVYPTGRCKELDCPLLALRVFGDHPKYGLALSSFPAARTLIHSLYRKHPLENTIAAVSLLGMNNLAPVTSDPASCAMLYAACLRSKNEHASLLGRDIRVALQKLLSDTKPYTEPKERHLRARYSIKPDLWLLEALGAIKQIKKDQGRGSSWITEWIARGEGRVVPPLSERRHQARSAKHLQRAAMPTTGQPLQQVHA